MKGGEEPASVCMEWRSMLVDQGAVIVEVARWKLVGLKDCLGTVGGGFTVH